MYTRVYSAMRTYMKNYKRKRSKDTTFRKILMCAKSSYIDHVTYIDHKDE